MNQIIVLLAGIAVAAPLFAALIWSAAQAIRHPGALRAAHVLAIAATFAVMLCLTWNLKLPSQAAGVVLALAALRLLRLESGLADRVLPAVQLVAGLLVAAALPFGG